MRKKHIAKIFIGTFIGIVLLSGCESSVPLKERLGLEYGKPTGSPTQTPKPSPTLKPNPTTTPKSTSTGGTPQQGDGEAISIYDLLNKKVNPKTTAPSMNRSKDFTIKQLKEFDGKYGRNAYIAVEGMIYDLTNSKDWKNGKLKIPAIIPGTDCTKEIMNTPKKLEPLKNVPVIGLIIKD